METEAVVCQVQTFCKIIKYKLYTIIFGLLLSAIEQPSKP